MVLHEDECDQTDAEYQAERCQNNVDGDGVVVEEIVIRGIDQWLRQVDEATEADDGAVYTTKRGESEDLGRIIPVSVSQTILSHIRKAVLTTWQNSTKASEGRRGSRCSRRPTGKATIPRYRLQ